MKKITIFLKVFEGLNPRPPSAVRAADRRAVMEFHIRRDVRDAYALEQSLFSLRGNVVLADLRQARTLAQQFNEKLDPPRRIRAGELNAMGLIDEILHYLVALYREQVQGDVFSAALDRLASRLGSDTIALLMERFTGQFPPRQVYAGNVSVQGYLQSSDHGESCRALALEELLLLALANLNPAFQPFYFMFDDRDLEAGTAYNEAVSELRAYLAELPPFGPEGMNLWDLLRAPALACPDSLAGQLEFMRKRWGLMLGKFMARLLMGIDVIHEEEKPVFAGPGPSYELTYDGLDEYERFSPDQDWMPRTVLIAKSTLVWLFQLSQKYGRSITRLDHIPDEELDGLARRGFTGLWLIGLWERSSASKTIKQWTGNPEAAASAYSLYDYGIAGELGGWPSLENLRERCFRRGIRLGSDMVPNHTGIDSRWIIEHPDRFLQLPYPPFPAYTYNCGNLSGREDVTVQIEEHYFTRTDAAVVFKRIDNRTGEARYIYHGNDGTSMPWNDTAQIDFLNPEAREAVIQTIIGVCKQFSIVRFDAAMTLAKRHIQRLWYPEPGRGGDIASRAEHAVSNDEFNRRIPNEFWREVVDRCAAEAPNTLLLAEAFWMMEGYFVRTLGMHRVYNSAFMNMLKNEENAKYRATIKNTLEFDPEILKRFVNFMNNPDEETAAAQFGKGDKYFGVCTLLVTMPGLPMFGHGQIEGFEEKYGMEYRRAYRDEQPDSSLVDRHEREIFPLMKRRQLFSGSADFCLFDCHTPGGAVNENIFAYSNRCWDDRTLVLYNNAYPQAAGWVHQSAAAIPQKDGGCRRDSLAQALSLRREDRRFTLLREQRSAQWFIRSSKEIHERGLFVSLQGYEAQVFLDIHEVEDGAQDGSGGPWANRWSALHHALNGRGVLDIQGALLDIFLGELYAPLMAIFAPQRMEILFRRFAAGGAEDDQTGLLAAAFREPVMAFITTAQSYLSGAEGRYDPFISEEERAPLGAEQIFEDFAVKLEHLDQTARYGNREEASGETAGNTPEAFLRRLGKRIAERPVLAAVGLAYGVLGLLRFIAGEGSPGWEGKALGDHWKLDRKLQEALGMLGIPDDEASRMLALANAVVSRTGAEDFSAYAGGQGAALIAENYKSEDFRRLLRINRFEDITWFNKEAFEEALAYAPFFLALESDAAFTAAVKPGGKEKKNRRRPKPGQTKASQWLNRVGIIGDMAEQFIQAEAASAYRLDRLMDALAKG
ncbi:MAG: alpha-amylase [Treponema sp.]|jgi:glycosidase|nr:alpha-amylase [Treponema sp.]